MLSIAGKPLNYWTTPIKKQTIEDILRQAETPIKQYKRNPRIISPLDTMSSSSAAVPSGLFVLFSALGFFLAFFSCRNHLLKNANV